MLVHKLILRARIRAFSFHMHVLTHTANNGLVKVGIKVLILLIMEP